MSRLECPAAISGRYFEIPRSKIPRPEKEKEKEKEKKVCAGDYRSSSPRTRNLSHTGGKISEPDLLA